MVLQENTSGEAALNRDSIIEIALSYQHLLVCAAKSREVTDVIQSGAMQGRSHIRNNENGDRAATLSSDNLTGQVGTLALHIYLRNRAEGMHTYLTSRYYAMQNPTKGDGGMDFPMLNIDIKASRIRNKARDFVGGYHLIVRPKELHPNWLYYHALVDYDDDWQDARTGATVYLTGWATSEMLPRDVATDGVFAGAYVLPVSKLVPIPPYRWVV